MGCRNSLRSASDSTQHRDQQGCVQATPGAQLQANLTAINFLFQMGEMGYRQVDGQVGRDH